MASATAIVRELRSLGKPNTAKIYARHGVREESVGLSYADLGKLVERIGVDHGLAQALWRTGIHRAKNRTRHAMNGALIAIGGSMQDLRGRALEVAEAIGKVEVDHGETGCQTPDAAAYIAKMVAHAKKKTAKKQAKKAAKKQAKKAGKKQAKKAAKKQAWRR